MQLYKNEKIQFFQIKTKYINATRTIVKYFLFISILNKKSINLLNIEIILLLLFIIPLLFVFLKI